MDCYLLHFYMRLVIIRTGKQSVYKEIDLSYQQITDHIHYITSPSQGKLMKWKLLLITFALSWYL